MLDADRTLLSQALANLLDNAVEAHSEGPIHVRLAARAEPGSLVRIDVSDRGAGMAEDRIAELDGPYTSTKPGGSGVGYRLVRKIVEEAHGGEVSIASELGRGTTMTLLSPARRPGMRRARKSATRGAR